MTVVVVSYIVIAPEGFVRFFKKITVKTIEMYGLIIAGIVTIIYTTLFFMYKSNLHKVKNIAKIA